MTRISLTRLLMPLIGWWIATASVQADVALRYPPVGGIAMAADQKTMIVSVPSQGKLVYIDTIAEKELKQVEVDFQPTLLAVQGKKLFAAVKGAAKIVVLDAESAKALQEIELEGEPLYSLGCHPSKGRLYAVNLKHQVFSIDPESGKAQKTKAKGQLLAVDPSGGEFVYTGIQKPINDMLLIEEAGGNLIKISLVQANLRALMLKYKVEDGDLALVEANDNAAVNGRAMAVSADGKQIAMAGGGGWKSKTDPRYNYCIAVFSTAKMNSLNGQVETGPYPNGIAFHPVLNLGAAFNTKEVTIFQAKSFVTKHRFKTSDDSFNHSGYLLFGGRGTKVIYCSYNAPINKDSVLQIFSLPLTPEEQATLKKAYERRGE